MSETKETLSKGYNMEELLRDYFLKAGYYAIRGVPFMYEGFDVTDIDIWLYSRTSSVSREVTIVDSKNKKTPQAIERIFWIQGLKIATKSTNAIVATTEKRQEVKDFGKELGVAVLDGTFLSRLGKSDTKSSGRLSDEELNTLITNYTLNKLDGDWKGRIKISKSLLSKPLSFDSCNEWLSQGKFFAERVITNDKHKEIALRCLYLITSFIAIGIDFTMKELSFQEAPERSRLLKEGFTYGSRGSIGIQKILDISMGLVEEHARDGQSIARQVRNSVQGQLAKLNTGILGEYFSRNEVSKSLFAVAKELEQLAMNRYFTNHNTASVELKSMLYCFLDYWGLDRAHFSERR